MKHFVGWSSLPFKSLMMYMNKWNNYKKKTIGYTTATTTTNNNGYPGL